MSEPITLTERERHTADMLAVAIKKWLADSGFVDTARAEGFRAGIEAAAQLARAHAATQVHATFGPEATLQDALAIGYQQCGDAIERAIRALADKPAPDAARKGG